MPFRILVLALLSVFSSIPPTAEDVVLVGRTLHLPVSDGYCALDSTNDIDSMLLRVMADMQRGTSELAAYWVDCEQIARFRSGESDDFSSFVLLLAQLSGHTKPTPVDMALNEYLALMKRHIVKANGGKDLLPGDIQARVRERLDETLANIDADGSGIAIGETRQLGLLDEDSSALYLGMIMHAVVDGQSDISAAAIAMTELNGLSMSVNVYDDYRDAESFEALLARARAIAAEVVAVNPTLP
jgi:hypothetical protein